MSQKYTGYKEKEWIIDGAYAVGLFACGSMIPFDYSALILLLGANISTQKGAKYYAAAGNILQREVPRKP